MSFFDDAMQAYEPSEEVDEKKSDAVSDGIRKMDLDNEMAPNIPPGSRVIDTYNTEGEVIGERLVSERFMVGVKPYRTIERLVEVPQVTVREVTKVVKKPEIHERIVEKVKIDIVEKIVEVPQTKVIERVVDVPEVHYQEKVVEVPKVIYEDRVVEVPKVGLFQ